ncbi:HlyD family efflux transporter periplasmic adaptor subunit [Pontivivens insulae]|uniref:Colicin V secretion protein CvaA n=1 Tax=Pontivivens insulae TaxID=1639689 RepID=A0A2R8AGB0_9RHOB|nr:HlyD family efflux transporter periplasmic adaptor subunit [Pontivivens insulae]RED10696.1 membrane fusion protein [Pontivivens insulae]SPF31085.1 Colicin V secretion protein CvaA [Pontivivens insulae]
MLFRRQVVEGQRQRLLGQILIATPIRFWIVTGFLAAFIAGLIFFIAVASFARIETVRGVVVPSSGIVHVRAAGSGVVSDFAVEEGDSLQQGQVVGRVTASNTSDADGTRTNAEILSIARNIAQLDLRREQLATIVELDLTAKAQERRDLARRIDFAEQRLDLQVEMLRVLERNTARISELAEQNLINAQSQSAQLVELIRARQAEQQLRTEILELNLRQRGIAHLEHQLIAQARFDELELEAERARLENELNIISGATAFDIIAPADGTVTAILASDGFTLSGGTQIFSILPKNSTLEVELYVPSRAIGFIETGQDVRLLFDAFPFQRYGAQHGRILQVTSTVITPTDTNLLVDISEPVYRVTVSLASDTIAAEGRNLPVQPGMLLNANIVLEERTILAWLLEPLFSIARRT